MKITLIGAFLGHHRITARRGAGGMGEVCRATDTKPGRDVAIKLLASLQVWIRGRILVVVVGR